MSMTSVWQGQSRTETEEPSLGSVIPFVAAVLTLAVWDNYFIILFLFYSNDLSLDSISSGNKLIYLSSSLSVFLLFSSDRIGILKANIARLRTFPFLQCFVWWRWQSLVHTTWGVDSSSANHSGLTWLAIERNAEGNVRRTRDWRN